MLGRPEIVEHVMALVLPNLEEPLAITNLPKLIAQLAAKAPRDAKSRKKRGELVRSLADAMRAADLDRFHMDAVLRELDRAHAAGRDQATWWSKASAAEGATFLDELH
ncbi:MAG TPA: hypothetical protein PKU97_14245, partial [Kofleriaceae bacterium]|nr:hypothetical protein [Kofleriaceae bacterium]